ncbi:unnamed protein product, partial [Choristocarpus tenellus]
ETGNDLEYVDLGSGRTATAIYSGPCALLDNNKLKCWGENLYGTTGIAGSEDVGDDIGEMGDDLPYVDLGSGITPTIVASGSFHNCAIVSGGDVKCWGKNTQGNLGIGSIDDRGDDEGEMGDG